jgi:hypothetical protein
MSGKRKQAQRRFTQRVRQNEARLDVLRRVALRPPAEPGCAPRSLGCWGWFGLLLAGAFTLAMSLWLLWAQVQIGRVLLSGRTTHGIVAAVSPCSRATAGHVTLDFTDAQGTPRQVRHTDYTPGCWTTYTVGEEVDLRYVPDDPPVLVTQQELARLWISLLVFGLGDSLFLGGGTVAFCVLVIPPRLLPRVFQGPRVRVTLHRPGRR